MPTCTSLRTPAARQASTTLRVPPTFTRSKSAGSPQPSTFAAAWKASLAQEALDERGADEAGAAGDEGAAQRLGRPSPHSVPVHGLWLTSDTFALPLLSRVIRKLDHAVLFAVVVSRKLPSGFATETR